MRTRKTTIDRRLAIYGFEAVHNGHTIFALREFDIIDGAPAARFLNRLRELVEKEYERIIS